MHIAKQLCDGGEQKDLYLVTLDQDHASKDNNAESLEQVQLKMTRRMSKCCPFTFLEIKIQ